MASQEGDQVHALPSYHLHRLFPDTADTQQLPALTNQHLQALPARYFVYPKDYLREHVFLESQQQYRQDLGQRSELGSPSLQA